MGSRKFSTWAVSIAAVTGFIAGGVITWLVVGSTTAEWTGAIGTWVGSLGAIGALLWAVHTFVEQNEEKVRAKIAEEDAARTREEALAEGVRVKCRGGGGGNQYGEMMMNSIEVDVTNDTREPAGFTLFELPGVTLKRTKNWPPTMSAGSVNTFAVNTEPFPAPDDEFSGKPLNSKVPTFRYRLGGVEWQRTGDETPIRVSELGGS
ncbi:hypothetical protein [Rhodococcus aetherivorans]|uniref:hypothetical protein n=1 Tax=Rhodococcus aetherivorans TaxID=191292 RepID=UPI00241D69F4|nr:hypothetical protein [Rhodococcus aetherivorans]WFS13793.1 hypothetical protein P9K37_01350 [Rhodococcus aetherivorans]